MDSTEPTRLDRRQDVPGLVRERFDLEPEPALQPDLSDVLEAVAEALAAACELAEPRRTAARTLTVLSRVQAASAGHDSPAELVGSLGRLVQDWRAS